MGDFALNVAISDTPKEYAVRKPSPGSDSAAGAEVVKQEEVSRESALRWEKTESKGKGEKENLRLSVDTVKIGPTTVAAPEVVKAPPVVDIRRNLKEKFIKLFEKTYANCFSHNRLLAKVAEWMVGNILERLALLGMSPQELAEIKDRVRDDLILQNRVALSQVIYDESMLEIVA